MAVWLQAFTNTYREELNRLEQLELKKNLNSKEIIMLQAILASECQEDLLATTLGLASVGAIAGVGLVVSVLFPPTAVLVAGVGAMFGLSRLAR